MSGNDDRPGGYYEDPYFAGEEDDGQNQNQGGSGEQLDDQDDEDGDFAWQTRDPAPRRRRKAVPLVVALVGLCALAVVVTVTLSGSSASARNATPKAAPTTPIGLVPTVTDPAQIAQQVGQAFLADWQAGKLQQAADLTDSPAEAATELAAYRTDLKLTGLTATLQNTDESGNVSFSVSAGIGLTAASGTASATTTSGPGTAPAASTAAGTWSYTSALVVEPVSGSKSWQVQWQPSVLGANLTADTHLLAVAVSPGVGTVTDDAGNSLSGVADPGLQKIAGLLQANAPAGVGTPGINIEVVDDAGTPVPGIAAAVITPPVTNGALATTIDPKAEAAAMSAVGMFPRSSMAVIQPSTGKILAIANNDQDNDDALTAQIAPGSTMKVITSTALLNQGLSENSPVGCPATYTVTGVPSSNSDGESEPDSTPFIDDFAVSCNNAFTTQYQKLSGGVLAATAQKYFGLNEPWDIGLGDPSTYFTMPTGSVNSELAAETFGQGTMQASPLAMASVAATVDTGSFHQPILVPGTRQLGAAELPSGTASQLRDMMRAVVTKSIGTAHDVGFGSGVYAKTGTADHGVTGTLPNSWIIVFDPAEDIAIGCVVLDGDFGAQSAGPEAESVLNAL
ncbi:MAG TPA: penicillin-binding transpeptidase domain-containing protein [Actinocrinis sp.]|nr:penicillin-binding transpeptidase domain-containing protein [Actinocrinis sp.]